MEQGCLTTRTRSCSHSTAPTQVSHFIPIVLKRVRRKDRGYLMPLWEERAVTTQSCPFRKSNNENAFAGGGHRRAQHDIGCHCSGVSEVARGVVCCCGSCPTNTQWALAPPTGRGLAATGPVGSSTCGSRPNSFVTSALTLRMVQLYDKC